MAHDPLEYLQSVWHRSTSYTYRMPLKIGASIANADDRAFAAYSRLGEEIGLAFRVIDDQINVVPLTEEWSKTTAEDIAAGTVTLQVLLILQRADRNRAANWSASCGLATDQRELRNAVGIMRQHLDACLRIISNISNMDFLHSDDSELWCSFIPYFSNRDRWKEASQ